jgi:hypothetical protein
MPNLILELLPFESLAKRHAEIVWAHVGERFKRFVQDVVDVREQSMLRPALNFD